MSNRRVIFMGTPEFAVATLDALMQAGIDVAGVVTAPDRPAGRGRQLKASAVKERAIELGLPVLQPEKLKDPEFHAAIDALDASLYIVVAFRMLPEVVWQRPALGTVNLHGSLLPAYRGAAPINWAIINGEKTTGVTTFKIQQEIDTGDILLQEELSIGPEETAGELHDRMMHVGAQLMVRTVEGLFAGTLKAHPQRWPADGTPPAAPKIHPETCRIHMDRNAARVHDLIRGMSPFPGAWCTLHHDAGTMHFKILRTRHAGAAAGVPPGAVDVAGGRFLFACADGWLEALEVQPEGKRRMSAMEFVRGIRATGGIRLS
jgi:methionyl-tRNA formyltransferase